LSSFIIFICNSYQFIFFSIPSKITIETIFSIFTEKDLALAVSEPNGLSNSNELGTSLKMDSGNKDVLAPNPHENTLNMFSKVEQIAEIRPDFSKFDSLVTNLNNNINTLNTSQLVNLQKEIYNEVDALIKFSGGNGGENVYPYLNLSEAFYSLQTIDGHSDIVSTLDKLRELQRTDLGKPNEYLLKSNPEKHSRDMIRYTSKTQDCVQKQCSSMKNYVKGNSIISPEDKKICYTAINKVNKNAVIIANADKLVYNKITANSVILQQLYLKTNK